MLRIKLKFTSTLVETNLWQCVLRGNRVTHPVISDLNSFNSVELNTQVFGITDGNQSIGVPVHCVVIHIGKHDIN